MTRMPHAAVRCTIPPALVRGVNIIDTVQEVVCRVIEPRVEPYYDRGPEYQVGWGGARMWDSQDPKRRTTCITQSTHHIIPQPQHIHAYPFLPTCRTVHLTPSTPTPPPSAPPSLAHPAIPRDHLSILRHRQWLHRTAAIAIPRSGCGER